MIRAYENPLTFPLIRLAIKPLFLGGCRPGRGRLSSRDPQQSGRQFLSEPQITFCKNWDFESFFCWLESGNVFVGE